MNFANSSHSLFINQPINYLAVSQATLNNIYLTFTIRITSLGQSVDIHQINNNIFFASYCKIVYFNSLWEKNQPLLSYNNSITWKKLPSIQSNESLITLYPFYGLIIKSILILCGSRLSPKRRTDNEDKEYFQQDVNRLQGDIFGPTLRQIDPRAPEDLGLAPNETNRVKMYWNLI